MVLGHLTVTAAAREILGDRLRPVARIPLGLLVLGAYLPDLVDKPLNRLTGLSARGYGHSLVVQIAVFAVAWFLFPFRRSGTSILSLGAALHLLEDWVEPQVLLAPLLGPIPQRVGWSLVDSFFNFYRGGGAQVWFEAWAVLYWVLRGATPGRDARAERPVAE